MIGFIVGIIIGGVIGIMTMCFVTSGKDLSVDNDSKWTSCAICGEDVRGFYNYCPNCGCDLNDCPKELDDDTECLW